MSLPTFVTHYMVRRPKSAGRMQSGHIESRSDLEHRRDRKVRGADIARQGAAPFEHVPSMRRAG